MKPYFQKINIFLIFIVFFVISCAQENINRPLTIRLGNNPEALNPVTFQKVSTRQIFDLVYQTLFTISLPDGEIKPVLASSLTELNETDSGFFMTVNIRKNAFWNSNNKVTTNDVAFSLKMINLFEGEQIGITNETNNIENFYLITPNEITFKFRSKTSDPLTVFDNFYIYPEHLFDPNYELKPYSLEDIRSNKNGLLTKKFLERIKTFNFIESKEKLIGSNAYQLDGWQYGEKVTLVKKKLYWFDNEDDPVFQVNPDTIIFQVIPNHQSAILALKNNQIDVLSGLSPHEFNLLKNDLAKENSYNFYEVESYDLTFFGVNGQKPPFNDINFRKGMAHLLPYDKIIKHAIYEVGMRTIGFIPPHQKEYYNSDIVPRKFNLDSALNYFKNANWTLQDGLLINSEGQTAEYNLAYCKKNKDHETSAFLMKNAFQKAGITVNLWPLDLNLLKEKLMALDFDFFIKNLSGGATAFDYEYILHSNYSPPNGWNFSSFGTPVSDSLIYQISSAPTKMERKKYLMEFQEILFDQCNIMPLYNEKHTIIVNSNYENLNISSLKPGYTLASFKKINP